MNGGDYHVVHVPIARDDDRATVAMRIERECNLAAAEGWLLHETIPETDSGTTSGVWLVFEAAEDGDDVSEPSIVAEAEQILEEGGAS